MFSKEDTKLASLMHYVDMFQLVKPADRKTFLAQYKNVYSKINESKLADETKALLDDCLGFLKTGKEEEKQVELTAEVMRGIMAKSLCNIIYNMPAERFTSEKTMNFVCRELIKCLQFLSQEPLHTSKTIKDQAAAILKKHPKLNKIELTEEEKSEFTMERIPLFAQLATHQKSGPAGA